MPYVPVRCGPAHSAFTPARQHITAINRRLPATPPRLSPSSSSSNAGRQLVFPSADSRVRSPSPIFHSQHLILNRRSQTVAPLDRDRMVLIERKKRLDRQFAVLEQRREKLQLKMELLKKRNTATTEVSSETANIADAPPSSTSSAAVARFSRVLRDPRRRPREQLIVPTSPPSST